MVYGVPKVSNRLVNGNDDGMDLNLPPSPSYLKGLPFKQVWAMTTSLIHPSGSQPSFRFLVHCFSLHLR